jgi:hypothetical protein
MKVQKCKHKFESFALSMADHVHQTVGLTPVIPPSAIGLLHIVQNTIGLCYPVKPARDEEGTKLLTSHQDDPSMDDFSTDGKAMLKSLVKGLGEQLLCLHQPAK